MARSPFASREQYPSAGNKLCKKEKFEFETSWWSVLLVEETGVPGENYLPVASH
jgi:hypothetical protein